jgi:hypothetical protein
MVDSHPSLGLTVSIILTVSEDWVSMVGGRVSCNRAGDRYRMLKAKTREAPVSLVRVCV